MNLTQIDPINGGRVAIFQSPTNTSGYAYFSDVKPGSYWVSADQDATGAEERTVVVSPSGPADATLYLSWPGRTPMAVQAVRGDLREPGYFPAETQGLISLTLLDGISGRELATAITDDKGRLQFSGAAAPGIYFLRSSNPGGPPAGKEWFFGTIPIEIDPAASHNELSLDVGWWGCEPFYVQREREAELEVSKICREITDENGGVSRAMIWLFEDSADGKMVTQAQPNAQGAFSFEDQPEGRYRLDVRPFGLPGASRFVRVKRSGPAGGCETPIQVNLRIN